MKTKTKNDLSVGQAGFKAVDFMRKVREELSTLYITDKKRYFEEIKKAMTDFKATRQKNTAANNLGA